MGKVRWSCFPLSRLTGGFRRCPLSGRSLIVASVCLVYLFFVMSQVDLSQSRRAYKQKFRHLHVLDNGDSSNQQGIDTGAAVPTRSNVVYITLRSKRLKPAKIRATVRPKLRRKARRKSPGDAPFTQKTTRSSASWRTVDHHPALINDSRSLGDSAVSAIRIYSRQAPPWFSAQDVRTLRFLAESKVARVMEVSEGQSRPFLLFEGETRNRSLAETRVCAGQCGLIGSPGDISEVFAFHLDRVLELNRTSPAVSRRFNLLHDGRPCPVVAWEESLRSADPAAGRSTVRVTWGQYQRSLKQRCWLKNTVPKEDSGCSSVHHHEWSKVALFDFMLQIHNRLDQSCCGFRPRHEDSCADLGHEVGCKNQDQIPLGNIVHKRGDPRHLVFTQNKAYFDRNEDNLDFRLLEGIKELPEAAVSVLTSRKLREKLLQSLFLDQTYWESQGGRQGIETLIDVIERRAQVLLTYINAHGVKVVPMNN